MAGDALVVVALAALVALGVLVLSSCRFLSALPEDAPSVAREVDEALQPPRVDTWDPSFWELTEVIPARLYLSNCRAARDADLLLGHGVRYVVSLTTEPMVFFPALFEYTHIAIADREHADILAAARRVMTLLDQALERTEAENVSGTEAAGGDDSRRARHAVLVHCVAGVSRSVSVALACLMRERRWGLDRALRFLRERRKVAQPNFGFARQLLTLEAELELPAAERSHDFMASFVAATAPDLLERFAISRDTLREALGQGRDVRAALRKLVYEARARRAVDFELRAS